MQTEYIAIAVSSALIGVFAGYAVRFIREKAQCNDLRVELARKTEESLFLGRQLADMKKSNEAALSDLETSWKAHAESALEILAQEKEEEIERAKNTACPFRILITPFAEHIKDGGIFTDTHIYTRGFQYQLVVHGVPCFEPHYIVEERSEGSSFNHAKLKQLADTAFESANRYVELQAASASTFFDVAASKISRLTQ